MRSGRELVRKTGMWLVEAPRREPEDLNAQVAEVLSRLTQNIEVWKALAWEFELNLHCGLFMASTNDGLCLSVSTGLSFIASVLRVCVALFFTPSMRSTGARLTPSELGQLILITGGISAACGWPWYAALSLAKRPEYNARAIAFSVASFAIAACFFLPILRAPAEGIGYNIIFCVLLIWLSYPATRMFSS